jgi:hypothetical protein
MIDLPQALEQALDRVDSSLGDAEIGRGPQHVRALLSGFDILAEEWNIVADAVLGGYEEQRAQLDGSPEDEQSLAAGLLAYGLAIGELHANGRHADLSTRVRRAGDLVRALRRREETFDREVYGDPAGVPARALAGLPIIEQHIDALEAGIAALQTTLEGGVRDALDG